VHGCTYQHDNIPSFTNCLTCYTLPLLLENEELMSHLSHLAPLPSLPVLEMAYFSNSNVLIQGGTFQSAQDIYNRDSESGLHILRLGVLLERFITRPNATRHQIAILIPARPFDRLLWSGLVKARNLLSFGFTDLQVLRPGTKRRISK